MAINRALQTATGMTYALTAGSLLVLALTGCSPKSVAGGAAPKSASTPATSAATPSAPPAKESAHGKLDGVPSACPSADVVMSNLHLTSLVVHGADPSICEYLFKGNNSEPYVTITFNANPGITPAGAEKGLKQEQKDVRAVPGLADAAFSFAAPPGQGLTFLSGDTICSILVLRPTTTSAEVALAGAIIQG
jgi:hypothetical protein